VKVGSVTEWTSRLAEKEGFQSVSFEMELEMSADLETLVVAGYYFASLLPVPRRGRPARVSGAELVRLPSRLLIGASTRPRSRSRYPGRTGTSTAPLVPAPRM
jgi:hypothetical protein